MSCSCERWVVCQGCADVLLALRQAIHVRDLTSAQNLLQTVNGLRARKIGEVMLGEEAPSNGLKRQALAWLGLL